MILDRHKYKDLLRTQRRRIFFLVAKQYKQKMKGSLKIKVSTEIIAKEKDTLVNKFTSSAPNTNAKKPNIK